MEYILMSIMQPFPSTSSPRITRILTWVMKIATNIGSKKEIGLADDILIYFMACNLVYKMFGYNKYVNIDDDDEYNINFGSVFSTKIHNLVFNNNSWVISRTSHLNTASHITDSLKL